MGLPFQLPLVVLSVWPWTVWPLIAGAAVLDGTGGAVTVPVAAEVAGVEPPALVAVTTTSIALPTSELRRV